MTPEDFEIVPQMPPLNASTARAYQTVVDVTTRCMQLSDQFETLFRQSLAACHGPCAASAVDCSSCIAGRLQSVLDAARQVSGSCEGKLRQRLIDLTGAAIGRANAAIGYQVPETDVALGQLAAGIYPTVGPLGPPPPAPPIQVLAQPGIIDPSPPVVILPQPSPFPTLGEPPPPEPIGPPTPFPAPPAGGGVCPAPEINIPACPVPPPPQIFIMPPLGGGGAGPLPPIGFDGNGNPIFPTLPPSTEPPVVILPPTEPPTEPPPVNVTVVVPPTPPPPAPPANLGGGIPPRPITDKASSWNAIKCPGIDTNIPPDFGGNWFKYLESKTGFRYEANGENPPTLFAPDGFFNTDQIHKLSTGEVIRFWASYAVSVGLPAIGATMVPPSGSCNVQLSIADYVTILVIEFVEKWVGVDLVNLKQPSKYDINYNCPSFLPGQSQVDDLYRKEYIDKDLWRCWTRANNNLDNPAAYVADAARPRLTLEDAWRISHLSPDAAGNEWVNALRFLGYADKYKPFLYDLQWQVPTLPQLTAWVRGRVDDLDAVNRYGTETGFNDLWTDEFSKYLESVGVRKGNAERDWRAGWRHISADQAQRMVWRSREGNISWPQGTEPVTPADVSFLRGLEGIAPFWEDKLAATARPIPNKRELAQLFEYETIDRDHYLQGLQDLGYTPENAERIVKLNEAKIEAKHDSRNHAISQTQIVTAFVQGLVNHDDAKQALLERGVSSDVVDRLVSEADWRRRVRVRRVSVKAIGERYKMGEFNADTAIGLLLAAGMETDEAAATVSTWKQTIKDKGKHASASQLCKWLDQNLLTAEEYYTRLVNLGWPNADAARIVESCQLDWAKKNTPKPPKPKPAPKPPKGK